MRNNKWTADIVMAHEFGHAAGANRIGLWARIGQESGDEGTALRYMRRPRDASGLFLRHVRYARYHCRWECNNKTSRILAIYAAIGDDNLSGQRDVVGSHGLGRSRRYWGNTGMLSSEAGRCNTFVAKARCCASGGA